VARIVLRKRGEGWYRERDNRTGKHLAAERSADAAHQLIDRSDRLHRARFAAAATDRLFLFFATGY
jgi:hypothetical protein